MSGIKQCTLPHRREYSIRAFRWVTPSHKRGMNIICRIRRGIWAHRRGNNNISVGTPPHGTGENLVCGIPLHAPCNLPPNVMTPHRIRENIINRMSGGNIDSGSKLGSTPH